MQKKILLIIAHTGFQPVEYGAPKKILTEAGIQVITASNLPGIATAARTEEKVTVDITLDEIKTKDFDGIFFIGGPGALEHLDNEKSYRIIQDIVGVQNFELPSQTSKPKIWGAICIAPRILAKVKIHTASVGVENLQPLRDDARHVSLPLHDKKMTGWNEDNKLPEILAAAGAIYVPEPVVVDGNLITAEGPAAAEEFGRTILKMLG